MAGRPQGSVGRACKRPNCLTSCRGKLESLHLCQDLMQLCKPLFDRENISSGLGNSSLRRRAASCRVVLTPYFDWQVVPQSTEPMDVDYGFQLPARRMPLTERISSRQQSPEEPSTSPPACNAQFMSTSERLLQKQNAGPWPEAVSIAGDASQGQARSASLQIPRTSRRGSSYNLCTLLLSKTRAYSQAVI